MIFIDHEGVRIHEAHEAKTEYLFVSFVAVAEAAFVVIVL